MAMEPLKTGAQNLDSWVGPSSVYSDLFKKLLNISLEIWLFHLWKVCTRSSGTSVVFLINDGHGRKMQKLHIAFYISQLSVTLTTIAVNNLNPNMVCWFSVAFSDTLIKHDFMKKEIKKVVHTERLKWGKLTSRHPLVSRWTDPFQIIGAPYALSSLIFNKIINFDSWVFHRHPVKLCKNHFYDRLWEAINQWTFHIHTFFQRTN
jgi:hypothetical protein